MTMAFSEYHKIQTVYLRDPETKFKTLLEWQYSLPEFEYLARNEWTFTEKVDGTNIRVMWDGSGLSYGGKTDNASIPAPLVHHLRSAFDDKAELFGDIFENGVCLYGEGFGGKIQAAGKLYGDIDFVLFDVRVGDVWLRRESVEDIAKQLQIPVVPIIGVGTLPQMVEMARRGFDSQWGNFPAEGIVARPSVDLFDRLGKRVITKIKTRDFS